MQRNCPNCGAVIDKEVTKCTYCGTSYFDISAINIGDGEPFYLKFKHYINGKPVIVTSLVRADPCITLTMEEENIYGGLYNMCVAKTSKDITLDMSFHSVHRELTSDPIVKVEYINK